MSVAQADLPWQAGILDGSNGRRAGAAVMTADRNDVCPGFSHTRRDNSNTGAGHQLHTNSRPRIDRPQIVDQLCEVFDAVYIVMRRRRDQHHAGHRVPQTRDVDGNLAGRQLTAFTRLGALRDLNLEFVGVDQIFRGYAESCRRNLFDPVVGLTVVAICGRVFAALSGIAASRQSIHGHGKRAMGLGRNCPQRHGLRAEAAQNRSFGLDLVERQRLVRDNL